LSLTDHVDCKKKISSNLYIKYTCATGDEYRAVVSAAQPQQEGKKDQASNNNSKKFIRNNVDEYNKAQSQADTHPIQVRCQSIRYLRICMGRFNTNLNLS
jgi:hypothetical protein